MAVSRRDRSRRESVIAVTPGVYRRNRDNRKAADIFSLAPRRTRSPPRPSDLDTETSFFYRFFSASVTGLARACRVR